MVISFWNWAFCEKFFLLYCYAHSIMRPKSRSDLEFLWMMLKRFGVKLPSLSSVLSFKMKGLEDSVPLKKSYGNGHPFYWIAPSDIIKLQMSTPSIATQLARYPEKTDRLIKQLYQGRKWHIAGQLQTSSATINGRTYYVKDLVIYKNGDVCHGKINRFFMKNVHGSLRYFVKVTKTIVLEPFSLAITRDHEEVPIESIAMLSAYNIRFQEVNDEIAPPSDAVITFNT
ncbi:uncharacterized protein LOC114529248 [Dendronephthya gigantea]|uniref:uncharacterized protein LOC114529248 n=1 Tax=Dendronephthya gigantea TaxID=151771 RepID=UPI00106CC1D3|nr:uncharacterized protein LOC114529248 [Dendronephthya gigantea]